MNEISSLLGMNKTDATILESMYLDLDSCIQDILEWTEIPGMLSISWFAFSMKRPLVERFSISKRIKQSQWDTRWKTTEVLETATLLELIIATTTNPFYFMGAFNLSFEACNDFMISLQIQVEVPVYVYALLCKELQTKEMVPILDMNVHFGKHSVLNLSKIEPCGMEWMNGHPFEDVDVEVTPPAFLIQHVKHAGELIGRIREKKWAVNKIEVIQGNYQWKTNHTAFVDLIRKLNKKLF